MSRAPHGLIADPGTPGGRRPRPGVFTLAEVETLPEPAQRHLRRAVMVGTPLIPAVRLRMHGRIRVGAGETPPHIR
jgi:hypothetical protein